ncbi:ATP phosphoribosyltransferase 2, chloroplastic-like [Olea europaea var. sylvestris]|uniref:ATP phosphoribosyltransferase 2, chloroplastic-like n=1 Tax=Olea europaea var. sylvestris TaxID=158386 RepID=UPI000C1D27FA|nr:ATP phosphoribosyltransferase 2, chloroplastic-like [Olea europaea var. sylvestris]
MPVVRTIFLQFHSASISPFLSSAIPASNNISEKFTVSCCSLASPVTVVNGNVEKMPSERNEVRLGLPSKGRMATDTLDLLKDCQLSVKQVNPRQYVAEIPQISNLEVWFQRPKDIVRKLVSGDLDLGIVGLDTVSEYGQVRIGLEYMVSIFVIHLKAAKFSYEVYSFTIHLNLFFYENTKIRPHYKLLTDPNKFNDSSLNMQGPTVSPVFCKRDGRVTADYYAIVICVPKKALYKSVQQLRAIGGSGVLISPLTYIFDEEPPRWSQLLLNLGL